MREYRSHASIVPPFPASQGWIPQKAEINIEWCRPASSNPIQDYRCQNTSNKHLAWFELNVISKFSTPNNLFCFNGLWWNPSFRQFTVAMEPCFYLLGYSIVDMHTCRGPCDNMAGNSQIRCICYTVIGVKLVTVYWSTHSNTLITYEAWRLQ